jgi:hypothetical protein
MAMWYNLKQWWFRKRAILNPSLVTIDDVGFCYVSKVYSPDLIEVYIRGKYTFSFAWIDGIEATPRNQMLKDWFQLYVEKTGGKG